MNKLMWVTLVCVLALPLGAQSRRERAAEAAAQEHAAHEEAAQSAPSAEQAPGMAGMQGMQEHMQTLREQMARIHATSDPAERQRLMSEHMQSMEEHMGMMGRMGQGRPGAGPQAQTSCAKE
jgi:protein CpxP